MGPKGAVHYLLRAPPEDRAVDDGADRGAAETPPLGRLTLGARMLEDRPLGDERMVELEERGLDVVDLRGALGTDRTPELGPGLRGITTGPGDVTLRPEGGITRLVGVR